MLEQTSTIPVVFVLTADPVGSGSSLPRQAATSEVSPRLLVRSAASGWKLLKEIARRQVTLLFNPRAAIFICVYLCPLKLPLRLSAWRLS
jgi:hypothetical protein